MTGFAAPPIGLILAAGRGRRFGSTKQLAKFDGEALVSRAVRAAERICGSRTLLVTGNDWKNVAAACEPLRGFMVHNPRFAEGMASSLAEGIRGVSGLADGVLLMLADQPLVSAEHLRSLADAWSSSPESICASSYANTKGPPVIFPARFFDNLAELQGDRGAKSIIDSNSADVMTIPFEDAAIDIDIPGDLDSA